MVTLYSCSNPISGLDFCLEALSRHQKERREQRAFLLVPEEAKADSERRYLEYFDRSGLMMAEVLSFRRFAHRIFSEAGGLAPKRIGDNGKALLICRLLQTEAEDFPVLGKLAGKGDYAAELSQILGDFSRYCVPAAALSELSAQSEALPELTRRKIRDLARLKERFDALKKQNHWVDSDEDFPRLCRLLREEREHPRLRFLSQSSLFVAGFGLLRPFTPQELELLQILGETTGEVHITVCDRPLSAEGTAIGRETMQRLRRIFPQAQTEIREEPSARAARRECLTFPDRSAEAAACAGEIRRVLMSGEMRRKDIAVACCREADRSLLAEVFREFGIDPYSAAASPLDESPLIRYLEAFFRLAGSGRPEDLISLGQSGLTDCPQEGLDRFENFLLASGCRYRSQLETEAFYRRRPLEGGAAAAFYRQYFGRTMQAVAAWQSIPEGDARARFLIAWLDEESGVRGRLEAMAAASHRRGLTEAASLLALSWEQLLSLLEDCVSLLGKSLISAEDFGELILSSLRHKIPAGIPLGLDRVRLGRPEQLLLYPCKLLFILGATASTFPPKAPGEGLLQNAERQWIEEESGLALPNYRRDSVPSGQALVWRLLSLPEERLVISCPSAEGWERSAAQRELEKLPEVSRQSYTEPLLPDVRWLSPARAGRYLRESPPFPGKEQWRKLLVEQDRASGPASLLSDPLYRSEDPFLYLPSLLTAKEHRFSISRLQTYSRCPYQYFAAYGLQLQERNLFAPRKGESGSFLHSMMEKAFLDLMEEIRRQPDAAAFLERWKQGIDDGYVRGLYRETARQSGQTRYLEPELNGGCGRFLRRQVEDSLKFSAARIAADAFMPYALEWPFPAADGRAPLTLRAGERELQFSGIVDRVDCDPAKGLFRIYDYKSGSAKNEPAELLAGWQLQLPLYARIWQHSHPGQKPDLLALHKLSADPRIVIDGFSARKKALDPGPDPKADEIRGEALDLYPAYAWAVSERLLAKMDKGDISPRPLNVSGKRPCEYCPYADLCRLDPRSVKKRERVLKGADTKEACAALLLDWAENGRFPEGV